MNTEALKDYSGGVKVPPQPGAKPDQTLVVWGWITTVLFWPAGLVISIILLARGERKGHGGAMLGVITAWVLLMIVIIMAAIGAAAVDASSAADTYSACVDQATTLEQMSKC